MDLTARFRAPPGAVRIGVGDEQELIATPLSPGGTLVPLWCAKLLGGLVEARTLEDHVEHLASELGADGREAGMLREGLARLVEAGALVPERALADRVLGGALGPDPRPPGPITCLGVPTRDRPDLLERAIVSYHENARAHGRAIEIVVADDAPDRDARDRARAHLRALSRSIGAPIAYAGLEEKLEFVRSLAAASGVPEDLVRFGLVCTDARHFGAGAHRNVLLLHGTGGRMLLADDDTVCRVAPVPDTESGKALSSDDDPTRFWFPDEGKDALDLVVPGPHDHLAAHEEMLGLRVSEALRPPSGAVLRLDRLGWGSLRRLRAETSRIVLTASGVAGDSGVGSPAFLLFLGARSRERLHRTRGVYDQAFTSRRIVRGASCPTVADSAFCMGLNLGVDLTGLMPPFMPVERNEDGVFGAAVRWVRRDGFFGFLPQVVAHLPPGGRSHTLEGVWSSLGGNNANDMLVSLMRGELADSPPLAPEHALSLLARQLLAWADLPAEDLGALLRARVWRERTRRMFELDERLRVLGRSPSWWAEAADSYLSGTRRALATPGFAVPRDLAAAFGAERTGAVYRSMLRGYGALVGAWPTLVDHTRRLRDAGIRPARAL
ncbi:MAG: hypothetical protein IPK82_29590 [Polyangiaceae bacterium]|nr:hypothetical protein [Polyangiaceae bacterium]